MGGLSVMISLILLHSVVLLVESFDYSSEPWNAPVLPATFPDIGVEYQNTHGKQIPRHMWMAFKEVPTNDSNRPPHLTTMFSRNTVHNWTLHLANNDDKLAFMETFYPNTSLLWAYKMIHPKLGNSAADIWRYCVLYLFGGLYMDDDSFFASTWDEVIGKDDTLIVAMEKNAYKDDCWKGNYRLSEKSMIKRFAYNTHHSVPHSFGGRVLVSWAIFAAPRHPIILRTMENIAELVKLEYMHQSAIWFRKYDAGWKRCMCSTGPTVLTASAREVLMENNHTGINYKVHKRDFHDFGGVYKVFSPIKDTTHYMHTTVKQHIPLLGAYQDLDTLSKDKLEGKVISCDGKEIFLVMNGTRYGFRDFDSFEGLGYEMPNILRIPPETVKSLPLTADNKLLTGRDKAQFGCCDKLYSGF